MSEQARDYYDILVMGNTGIGKSTTITKNLVIFLNSVCAIFGWYGLSCAPYLKLTCLSSQLVVSNLKLTLKYFNQLIMPAIIAFHIKFNIKNSNDYSPL